MALDPLLLGTEHTRIDEPANRYGHPLYGWVAGTLSLGRFVALPYVLVVLSILGIAAAGFAGSRLASALGMSPWLGLAAGLNPGLVYSVTVDTTEAFAAGLMMAGLLGWVIGRRAIAAVLIALLCFAKEPLLAVPVGLAAWELVRLLRGAPRGEVGRRLLLLAPGPLLYAAWYGYVRIALGAFPFEQAPDRLTLPFVGWLDTFRMAAQLATGGFFEMQSGQAAVPLLAVTLGAILVGIVAALRFRTPLDPISLLSGALLLCLGWLPLLYPKDLVRIGAFWLLLLPYVLLAPRRGAATTPADGPAGPGGPAEAAVLSPESSGTGTGR
jgi:hypothetical protein